MKFAFVDNQKVEATKGAKGFCCFCHQPVIAKCGEYRVNHWAHKNLTHCDKWWENETEWHRNWKDLFPNEWQEVVATDEKTGEKHIADIKTDGGMVIEFQHSYIKKEERVSREHFFKNMIWVVDGTRRKRDIELFHLAFNNRWSVNPNNSLYVFQNSKYYLPKEWLNCTMPVVFDFRGTYKEYMRDNIEYQLQDPLWCLLPILWKDNNILYRFERLNFIETIKSSTIKFNYDDIIQEIDQSYQERQHKRRYGY